MWPDVTILICTFNRPVEIVRTVEALKTNLSYSGALHWLVCDDSSPSGYVAKLKKSKLFKDLGVEFVSTDGNSGWAANVNNGLAHVGTDYVLFLEDDKELHAPLNLDVMVALMEVHNDIGLVRIKGTAGDHVVLHQFEADISAWMPEFRHGYGVQGNLTYLQLDSGSPSLWLYSNGMHLKHRRFHQFYGLYPTGLRLGATEEAMAHIVKNGMKQPGAPAIVILPEWVADQTEDFGQSFKDTEFDR
jgi:glycosyltransferase involved in cell wall biosynthesis